MRCPGTIRLSLAIWRGGVDLDSDSNNNLWSNWFECLAFLCIGFLTFVLNFRNRLVSRSGSSEFHGISVFVSGFHGTRLQWGDLYSFSGGFWFPSALRRNSCMRCCSAMYVSFVKMQKVCFSWNCLFSVVLLSSSFFSSLIPVLFFASNQSCNLSSLHRSY